MDGPSAISHCCRHDVLEMQCGCFGVVTATKEKSLISRETPHVLKYTSEGGIIYDKMNLLSLVCTKAPHLVLGHFVITKSLPLEYLNQLSLGRELRFDDMLPVDNNEAILSLSSTHIFKFRRHFPFRAVRVRALLSRRRQLVKLACSENVVLCTMPD